ncbi:hypothetical protein SAY86_018733 [Trapa natans]|uniref:Uncharacterized protein n=1 Tax=Trapa natans TaxID=22666 RepID=A0AAN7LFJ3_TRANT|nr:hypothetical protein SAY86_018733 [Trapa natans]
MIIKMVLCCSRNDKCRSWRFSCSCCRLLPFVHRLAEGKASPIYKVKISGISICALVFPYFIEHPSFTENERTWISLGIEILVPFWPLASLDRTMHVGHVLLVKDAAPFAAWGHFSNCGSWKWNC